MLPDMPEDTKPTDDDLIKLRCIRAPGRHGVMTHDVARWRAAGWLEPEPSWNLTPAGLALIDESRVTPDAPRMSDPGPDLQPPPAVRPRTPEEVLPARGALRRLSDALLWHENASLRACGRLAWLHSVQPLSTAEEVGDALSFAARTLALLADREVYQTVTVPDEQALHRAVLDALGDLDLLVDDMRAEVDAKVDAEVTDRRRSVTSDDGWSWKWEGSVGSHCVRVTVGHAAMYVTDLDSPDVDEATHRAALAEALGVAVRELRAASSPT